MLDYDKKAISKLRIENAERCIKSAKIINLNVSDDNPKVC